MHNKPLVILGCGGHAKVVAATAMSCGHEVVEFLDDAAQRWTDTLCGRPIRGPIDALLRPGYGPVIHGIGDNRTRIEFAARYGFAEWASLVHPRAFVDRSAAVGRGSVIFAGAIVQPDATIGEHVIINTGATVDHDCVIGDGVHIAPGVHLAGHVRVGRGAFIGVGAAVITRVEIGAWAVVGAGAVVIRAVPPHATVVGVPAVGLKREPNDA